MLRAGGRGEKGRNALAAGVCSSAPREYFDYGISMDGEARAVEVFRASRSGVVTVSVPELVQILQFASLDRVVPTSRQWVGKVGI